MGVPVRTERPHAGDGAWSALAGFFGRGAEAGRRVPANTLELPVDPVQRARGTRISSRRADPLAANRATRTLQFHQPRDRTACHRNTFPIHLFPDLRHTVDLHIGLPDTLDLRLQKLVAFGADAASGRISKLCSMTSVTRRGNLQDLADRLDPKGVAMLIDEGLQDLNRRSSSAWAKNAPLLRLEFNRQLPGPPEPSSDRVSRADVRFNRAKRRK